MLLETKEQQLIGYFCNYFVDLKTLLDNKDKLNLTEDCVKIIEDKLENGPKTINKYLPCGELFDQLYPLYEKNHKMELNPNDLESVKKFKEELIRKYSNENNQEDFYKDLLREFRKKHGLTEKEWEIITEEDPDKIDDWEILTKICEKNSDLEDLDNQLGYIIGNLDEKIFVLSEESQKTIDELFPGIYEAHCRLISIEREICNTEEILITTDGNGEKIHPISPIKEIDKLIKELSEFYPEKSKDQINKDSSKIIFGDKIKSNKEEVIKELKELQDSTRLELKKNPYINLKKFRGFYRSSMRSIVLGRLLINHFY